MNIMTEQIAKTVVTVKKTAWGGKHGSLALVLEEDDYKTVTRDVGATIDRIANPAPVN